MSAEAHEFTISTNGRDEVCNLTDKVAGCLGEGTIDCGIATVFVIGSTAAVTTTEYEPGLVQHDLKTAFEGIAPEHGRYRHEETWHDNNGHSHVRATILGPSLTIPIRHQKLQLGTWQQIILIDFDTRPRERRVLVHVVGE